MKSFVTPKESYFECGPLKTIIFVQLGQVTCAAMFTCVHASIDINMKTFVNHVWNTTFLV